MFDTTIAAISTPVGTGGISIIRISGKDAFQIAEKIFSSKIIFGKIASHTVTHGWINDYLKNEKIDEVLVLKLAAPKTFTGEDIIEIQCHGGLLVTQRILELVINNGASHALPGEFSKRAFLNGKMDLSQAEAVIDLINSRTEIATKIAAKQLEGGVSRKLKAIRSDLIRLMAQMEVNFEYPEYDVDDASTIQITNVLEKSISQIEELRSSFERGRLYREGINVVIAGSPNAGKSSILNALIGKNRAIVTDIPGTTRDVLEEYASIKGIPIKLLDTAGIRETEDIVETMGVERAKAEIDGADLVLLIIDGSIGIKPNDKLIMEMISGKHSICLINKMDISNDLCFQTIKEELSRFEFILPVSALDMSGFEDFENCVVSMFTSGKIIKDNQEIVSSLRHKELLDKASDSLKEAKDICNNGLPIDIASVLIKDGASFLGKITGENITEDVIKEIFENFCIGK